MFCSINYILLYLIIILVLTNVYQGFTDGSVDKESACNAGDPSWIPGSGRSTGEGISYPLQYSWASLVAQLVKNLITESLLYYIGVNVYQGLPDSSVDKESAYNAEDSGLIPGLGRSYGEWIGYPLQYSWASLMAQLVQKCLLRAYYIIAL